MNKEKKKNDFKGSLYYYKQKEKRMLDILRNCTLTPEEKNLKVYNMIEGFN